MHGYAPLCWVFTNWFTYTVGKQNTFRGSGGALTGSSGVLYTSSSGISGCSVIGLYVTLVEWGWG